MNRLAASLTLFAAVAVGCDGADAPRPAPATTPPAERVSALEDEVNPRLLRRFQPLPDAAPEAKALVDLGRHLYFDKRLSRTGEISCNSCHTLAEYGVDHRATSAGVLARMGTRNAPTVYNAAGHFAQFWDGRVATLEEQARGPITSAIEMGMPDGAAVVAVLKGIEGYRASFARAFPDSADPVTYENVGKAIGAFERGLVTPGRWDEFLRGKKDALTAQERHGLRTFLNVGCMVCHTGTHLGASMFERVGVVEPWPNQADQGRAELTHAPGDRMMFKVPSLRNVERTAPYFHDGSAATLGDAVRMMGKHQLGLDLMPEEIAAIVAWLKALTGPLPPADYIAEPPAP